MIAQRERYISQLMQALTGRKSLPDTPSQRLADCLRVTFGLQMAAVRLRSITAMMVV